jgi:hypothetical protein
MLRTLAIHAGMGFITGQGVACFSSLYHALRNASPGSRTQDCIRQFARKSVKMASWSLLTAAVEPLLKDRIASSLGRDVVSGAATSAVLAVRNGGAQIVRDAIEGEVQSATMNVLGASIQAALKAIDEMQTERLTKQFMIDRSEAAFQSPLKVLMLFSTDFVSGADLGQGTVTVKLAVHRVHIIAFCIQ